LDAGTVLRRWNSYSRLAERLVLKSEDQTDAVLKGPDSTGVAVMN